MGQEQVQRETDSPWGLCQSLTKRLWAEPAARHPQEAAPSEAEQPVPEEPWGHRTGWLSPQCSSWLKARLGTRPKSLAPWLYWNNFWPSTSNNSNIVSLHSTLSLHNVSIRISVVWGFSSPGGWPGKLSLLHNLWMRACNSGSVRDFPGRGAANRWQSQD